MSSTNNVNNSAEQPFFKRLWAGWQKFNHALGNFIAKLQLGLLYFIVILPFGLWTRFVTDPLDLNPKPANSYWKAYTPFQGSKPDLKAEK
jgi:hypothetical protein